MEVNAKSIENGLYSVVFIDTHDNMGTLVGTRQELRKMMKDLSDQISITKDLVHKIVCLKTNPDQHGTILGAVADSDSVLIVWHEGLNKTYAHIDDLTVLN